MMGDQLGALIPVAWRAVIDCAITETELEHLAARLDENHREIFPPREQWFRALDETPLCDVRAVILGTRRSPAAGSTPSGCGRPSLWPAPPTGRRCSPSMPRLGRAAPPRRAPSAP